METDQIIAMILAGAVPVVLAGLAWLRSEFVLRQARAEAERARIAAEAADTAKGEIVALGMALGAAMESNGGAPPPRE